MVSVSTDSGQNHRNGIKKTRRPRKMSMEGMHLGCSERPPWSCGLPPHREKPAWSDQPKNCRFVRNQAFAKRGMSKMTAEEKEELKATQREAWTVVDMEAQKKVDEKRKAERQACPMTTYPDNFQVCHACTVAGCQSCSKEGCEECILPATRILLQPDDFFGGHSESQCFSIFIFLHLAFVLFCLTSSVLILLRFLCLSCGSAKSPGALEHCLAHRRRAKVRNYHVPGNVLYSFSTNVQRENVSGLGLALYFRHVAFQGLLSFFLIALSAAGHFLPELTHESAFLPRLIPPDKLGLAQDLHALALYVFCFVATVRWLFTQGRAARAEYEEVPHLADYALFAEGFPK
ncbi:unnamed protein product [Durusdinium trenchii]|uniref:Uncharacterized protein n=1 Tax=Durusdinium trenchii TaxID=1381693 RepID=A0ABP0Q6X9_9DINO